jgi:Cu/Zn superoxide dismutase
MIPQLVFALVLGAALPGGTPVLNYGSRHGCPFVLSACAAAVDIATASFVPRTSTETVDGFIRFTQESPGGMTRVDVNLTGTVGFCPNDQVGGCNFGQYHIHEFPVDPTNPNGNCSIHSVGGHYNPLNKPICNYETRGDCELGDLSGKFGIISESIFTQTYSDNNLPLSGPYSIIGRSVVIHDMQGARWVCSTIMPVGAAVNNAPYSVRSPVVWPSSGFACTTSDIAELDRADRDGAISSLVVRRPACVNCLRSCGEGLDRTRCSAMCVLVSPAVMLRFDACERFAVI